MDHHHALSWQIISKRAICHSYGGLLEIACSFSVKTLARPWESVKVEQWLELARAALPKPKLWSWHISWILQGELSPSFVWWIRWMMFVDSFYITMFNVANAHVISCYSISKATSSSIQLWSPRFCLRNAGRPWFSWEPTPWSTAQGLILYIFDIHLGLTLL